MSLYRVKQFYWSITSKINKEDENFIKKYLDLEEISLFRKLATYEQKHCIKVALDVEGINNNRNLIRVALLHDIGKIENKLNPIEKSLVVMGHKLSKGKMKALTNIKKINTYYNHGDIGYNLLKEHVKYDDRFLYLIKNHHNNNIKGDKELDIIKDCDCNN